MTSADDPPHFRKGDGSVLGVPRWKSRGKFETSTGAECLQGTLPMLGSIGLGKALGHVLPCPKSNAKCSSCLDFQNPMWTPAQVRHFGQGKWDSTRLYNMFLQIYPIFLKDHSGHGINIPRISSQRPARLAQACSNLRRDSWSLGEAEKGINFAENDVFL